MDCCKSGPVAVIGHELIKKGDKDKLLLLLRSNLHK
jgi:NADH:ubiquinone oxidoreductase subunit E